MTISEYLFPIRGRKDTLMGIDLEKYMEELEMLVNIDSGTADVEGVHRMADALEKLYREEGLFVTRRSLKPRDIPHIIATTHDVNHTLKHTVDSPNAKNSGSADQEKPWDIMFIGHMDTVFPAGTVSERPFTIDGNKVRGPGAADMKAGDLMALYLIKELRHEFPDKCFAIVNNSDEEFGSPDSGQLTIEIAGNAKFAFDMEPGRINGDFVYERKGAMEYWVDLYGRASHAGNAPDKGINAIAEMARWIDLCMKYNNSLPGLTVTPTIIEGGTASNTVPDHAHLKIDVRIKEYYQLEELEKAFDELSANPTIPGIKAEWLKYSDMPPMVLTEETKYMVEVLKEEAAKMNYEFGFESAGGASDASFVSGGGTPVLDACGPHGEGLHSPEEYFLLDTVEPRYDLLANTIRRLLSEN